MITGAWPGLLTAYRNGLAAVCRRPFGHQVLRPRHRPPVAIRQTVRGPSSASHQVKALHTTRSKRSTGVMSWSLLVILVGQSRQSQVLERLKEITCYLYRTIVRQCEVHAAQKFRRGLQLHSAYSRMWGEEAARAMLANFRRILMSRGRHMLLSAVCFSNFNWNKERIPDESLQRAVEDLDSVGELCRATVECETCRKRQVIDQQMANIDYCKCSGSLGYTNSSRVYDSWEPFIELYGTYDDVSLSAFVEVQLNSNFRTDWDDTALQLRVLDSDQDSNSDLLYWLVKFPHFFANRDYLFKRRFTVNEEKEVVIMSEAIKPDYVPEEAGVHRVNEYWSTMPGLEYTLTYFDNPGTSLPQRLTNFIAATGFPNFLRKVHKAALTLQAVHEKGDDVYVSLPKELRHPKPKREPILERPSEPTATISKELELSVSSTEDTELKVDDSELKCELLSNQENLVVGKDLDIQTDKDLSLKAVTQILDSVKVQDITEDSSSTKYHKEDLFESLKTTQSNHKSEIHVEEPSKMSLQVIITSEEAVEKDIPAVRESDTFMKNNDKIGKMPSSTSDRVLHVHLGNKNVAVDLLEGMEVVAPDLESESLLLKKIEKIKADTCSDFGNHNLVMTKVKDIKNMIKLFQEHALKKKEKSMKKMEELAHRDHYHHSGADEKTLKHLEMLFQAMRDVLRADKDLRTGKGLMGVYAEHEEKDLPDTDKQNSASTESSKSYTHSQDLDNSRHPETRGKDSATPNGEKDLQLTSDKGEQKQSGNKDSQPPDQPPPPPHDSGGLSSSGTLELPPEGVGTTTNADIAAYSNQRNEANFTENESEVLNSWSSWIYIPNISALWNSGNKVCTNGSTSADDADKQSTNDMYNETNSKSFTAQVWYIVGLGWIFHTETKFIIEDHGEQGNKLQMKVDENLVSKNICDKDSDRDAKWYWYPVNGVYRVYAWVFSNSKENA
ncbi:StAR-related lipid transfer protein 7-like [Homarus americanus]|uniref:StAR-related lipid transfer protein 7-like n=1 Tax=Homarus americanus TaxID=6706 RepID=A0A8J5JQG5_HOMAM|nr:StAR-related lipid transfer protein 7-like [Homarus americanus]